MTCVGSEEATAAGIWMLDEADAVSWMRAGVCWVGAVMVVGTGGGTKSEGGRVTPGTAGS